MKKLVVAAAAVSILAFSALAYGQMGGHGMGPGMMGGQGMGCECEMMRGHDMGHERGEHEHPMKGLLKGLDLDEQQKTSIGEIRSRMMKDTIKREADVRIAHLELKDLLAKDPVDMKAVEAKVRQAEGLKTEMKLSHLKALEEIKAKLTPEQRKKFREMKADGPMMGGMGMMQGRKCGMGMAAE
jgi:Spy/CpxP family protein refolding chaperone